RTLAFGTALAAWSIGIFLAVPIYFPQERASALLTGLSFGNPDAGPLAKFVANAIPDEPALSEPRAPVAETLIDTPLPPPRTTLKDDQIALPYEGDGRRLSVEIAIQQDGKSRELHFLLDTGATYTTLPTNLLAELGIHPSPDDPSITLHTANGERDARIVLIDKVWLGDLALEGVAVATCDQCASEHNVGLLGLNVTGGYNLAINADRREVVFTRRADYSRHLDVKPFVDVGATVTRLPGRVTVEARLENSANRTVQASQASIHCEDTTWLVDIGPVAPGATESASRSLPAHDACERYQVGLHAATW
ncbi:MAG: TIGR02281 family clan AA aspartic protease, partial [Myxococcota bacterium]